ncbi:derlin-1 [Bemisia tabaci]|uniref:derlin-1 n=1 Tax=Bemisia tabaci TaxID=7038 RepID=UPI0008F9DED9|nr:PREDICTED: derlin-1 [Bemisia tabaci]XP_018916461.1 PREDICTED: derlin-1 [Bemisia tabaci]XP_018916463.1 PREDICTED: derlin-1 [Bemisia tabaci]
MSDISQWFQNLPTFTRHWLGLTVGISLIGRFGLLKPQYLILLHEPLINGFEIWRPITSVFFYPLAPSTGFHFLINCYFLYNYSLRLETGTFEGRPADYFFMLLFNWISCVIIGLLMNIPLLMDPMVLSVLYVWCQLNRDVIVTFWFGTRFKAMFLPWVLFGFNMIMSNGGLMELVGIVVGHLYYFLTIKYPQEMNGPELLSTPGILKQWFPDHRPHVAGFGSVPTPRRPENSGSSWRGHSWGRGQVLGGQ